MPESETTEFDAASVANPKRTWRRHLWSMALLLLIPTVPPLVALWFVVAQSVIDEAEKLTAVVDIDAAKLAVDADKSEHTDRKEK